MSRETRRAEKMALAVQGQDKSSVFCEKCFTVVPKGSDFCPNCGASLSCSPGAEGSDAAVYPKLAQANLLRMRKQYKEAEEICLAILHQYPHNLSANTLMGDISLDEHNLDQAAEWYELALDIDPDSASLNEKLHAVKHLKEHLTAETTAAQLGLPVKKPPTALITLAVVIVIASLGVTGAYMASRASRAGHQTSDKLINQPVVIPATPQATAPSNGQSVPAVSEDDQQLTQNLAAKTTDRANFMDARYDLPTDGIVITYNVPPGGNERAIGTSLATESFGFVRNDLNHDISQVELRAIKDKKLFYSAIVRKQDFEETQTPDWQNAHKDDPDAMLKKVLTNEKYIGADAQSQGQAAGNPGENAATQEGNAQPPSTTGSPTAPSQPATAGGTASTTTGGATG